MVRKDSKENENGFPEDPFDTFSEEENKGFEDGFASPYDSSSMSLDTTQDSEKDDKYDASNTDAMTKKPVALVINKEASGKEIITAMKMQEMEYIKKIGLGNYCLALGLTNAISGGITGAVVGAVSGAMEAYQSNLVQSSARSLVLRTALVNGVSFGGFLGVYTGSKCYVKHSRGKSDIYNSFIAGSVAGVVASLPMTRHPQALILYGLSSGAVMAAIDSFSAVRP